jgi:hypothetical protein
MPSPNYVYYIYSKAVTQSQHAIKITLNDIHEMYNVVSLPYSSTYLDSPSAAPSVGEIGTLMRLPFKFMRGMMRHNSLPRS